MQTVEHTPYRRGYVPGFTTVIHAEQWWIDESRSNIGRYIEYMTDGEITPARIHVEWLYSVLYGENRLINTIAFPGSAKTTAMTYLFSWIIGRQPILTNMIVSVSVEQAKDRLATTKEHITQNPRYKNIFPHIHIDSKRPNTADKLNIWSSRYGKEADIDYSRWRMFVSRRGQPKDHSLFAAGISSKSTIGKRVSGFLGIDDAHDEENSATPQQRDKIWMTVQRTLQSRLVPKKGRLWMIGTRWHEDDAAGRAKEQKRSDGQPVWTTIDTPIEDDEGNPTWEEVWNKEAIAQKQEELGGEDSPMYRLMYKNDAAGLAQREVTLDMLRVPLPGTLPEIDEVVIGCDFAHSKAQRADYTVYTAIGRDKEKIPNYYVLDIARLKSDKILSKCEELADFARGVHSTYGDKLKMVLMEKADSDAEYQMMLEKFSDIPVEQIATKGDKEVRFKQVLARIQQLRFKFNTFNTHYNAMCSEILTFPRGKHDDICDSMSIVYQWTRWAASSKIRAGTVRIRSPYLT